MSTAIKQIKAYNKGLRPEMKPRKWAALRENPFRFFRGTCHLFAGDFEKKYGFKNRVRTWVCGDLHFENFGSYKGANRLVYFDVSDFDEAMLGIPEIDISRFLASLILAGQEMKVGEHSIHNAVKELCSLYALTLGGEKAFMMEAELAHGVLAKYFEQLNTRDRQAFIGKHTLQKKDKRCLKIDDVHFIAIPEEEKEMVYKGLKPLLAQNRHFAHLIFEDVACRLAGTGSLGLERYGVLCYDKHRKKHYLVDVKEVRRSCYRAVTGMKQPEFANEAERVIYAQYVMQFNTPDFLTTSYINGKWFVVKEMQPVIDKMALPSFKNNFTSFTEAAQDMAPLIAYTHIRSSGHKGAATSDELVRFANKRQWQRDITELSWELAANNNKYYKQFTERRDK